MLFSRSGSWWLFIGCGLVQVQGCIFFHLRSAEIQNSSISTRKGTGRVLLQAKCLKKTCCYQSRGLTCPAHFHPASTCLQKIDFFLECWLLSGLFLRSHPCLHPYRTLWHGPIGAGLLLVSAGSSGPLGFLAPVSFAKKRRSRTRKNSPICSRQMSPLRVDYMTCVSLQLWPWNN